MAKTPPAHIRATEVRFLPPAVWRASLILQKEYKIVQNYKTVYNNLSLGVSGGIWGYLGEYRGIQGYLGVSGGIQGYIGGIQLRYHNRGPRYPYYGSGAIYPQIPLYTPVHPQIIIQTGTLGVIEGESPQYKQMQLNMFRLAWVCLGTEKLN